MTEVRVIGNDFMLSDMFEEKLINAVGTDAVTIRKHGFDWPGDPLVHGHTTSGMEGLKATFLEAGVRPLLRIIS